MEKWFNSLSIKELNTWIKNFENSSIFLGNQPSNEDIAKAKEILKKKKNKLKRQLNNETKIWFPNQ